MHGWLSQSILVRRLKFCRLKFKVQDFKMLRRYKLYFVAVVVAVTIFFVSFSLDSIHHVKCYNSGATRNVVSAVVEMEKINS